MEVGVWGVDAATKVVGLKTYLDVPFAWKDRAKSMGARFDMSVKKWFVPDGLDLQPFWEAGMVPGMPKISTKLVKVLRTGKKEQGAYPGERDSLHRAKAMADQKGRK